METRDETRRLLKVFGVSVTDFEEESEKLLERLQRLKTAPEEERVTALRDALELLLDVNGKWQATTEHLFHRQRRFLEQVLEALAKEGSA